MYIRGFSGDSVTYASKVGAASPAVENQER
jgi:hypothetical protein